MSDKPRDEDWQSRVVVMESSDLDEYRDIYTAMVDDDYKDCKHLNMESMIVKSLLRGIRKDGFNEGLKYIEPHFIKLQSEITALKKKLGVAVELLETIACNNSTNYREDAYKALSQITQLQTDGEAK